MSYAHRITLKGQEDPCWVAEIAGSTSYWFSTIPLAAKTAVPILSPITLPSKELKIVGGGSKVSTLTFTLQDKKTSYWAVTRLLYSRALVGSAVNIHFGYAADTTWSAANFPMLWSGYIKECSYAEGVWTVQCEDWLGKAKNIPLNLSEFTAEVNTAVTGISDTMALCKCAGTLVASVGSDLMAGHGSCDTAGDDAYWSAASVGGGTAPTLSRNTDAAYIRTGAGSLKVACTTGETQVKTVKFYDSGAYIALPAAHKPGQSYAVTAWCQYAVTEADVVNRTAVARLCVYGEKSDGTVQEYSLTPGGFKYTANTAVSGGRYKSVYAYLSTTICIYDPNTARLRVGFEFTYSAADVAAAPAFLLDDVQVQRVDNFVAAGREIYGVLAWTPNTGGKSYVTCSRSAFGTINDSLTVGEKTRRVYVFGGYSADVAARMLTATSAGTNGAWDVGDGNGCGIAVAKVDSTALAALRTSLPYHVSLLVLDKAVPDVLSLLDEEICKVLGGALGVSTRGLITLRVVPSSVAAGTHALTDAKLLEAKAPSISWSTSETYTVVDCQGDYDYLDEVKTARDANAETDDLTSQRKVDSPDRDAKYISHYVFDEQDYLTTGVFKDQNKASQAIFGALPYAVKAKSVRGLYSAQMGLPILRFNYPTPGAGTFGDEELCQKGEYIFRHLASRVLPYCNSQVHTVTWTVGMWAYDVEVGDTATMTSSYVPDMNPTTGGVIGISGVKGVVTRVARTPDSVTLDVVVTDWATAIAADQPAYVAPTDPGVANVSTAFLTGTDFTEATGTWEVIPKSAIYGIKVQSDYGGVACTLPSTNKFSRIEVRRYLNAELGYSTSCRFSTTNALLAYLATSNPGTRSIKVLWLFKDGTYSTAYTKSL